MAMVGHTRIADDVPVVNTVGELQLTGRRSLAAVADPHGHAGALAQDFRGQVAGNAQAQAVALFIHQEDATLGQDGQPRDFQQLPEATIEGLLEAAALEDDFQQSAQGGLLFPVPLQQILGGLALGDVDALGHQPDHLAFGVAQGLQGEFRQAVLARSHAEARLEACRLPLAARLDRVPDPRLLGGILAEPGRIPEKPALHLDFLALHRAQGGGVELQQPALGIQQADEGERRVKHGPQLQFAVAQGAFRHHPLADVADADHDALDLALGQEGLVFHVQDMVAAIGEEPVRGKVLAPAFQGPFQVGPDQLIHVIAEHFPYRQPPQGFRGVAEQARIARVRHLVAKIPVEEGQKIAGGFDDLDEALQLQFLELVDGNVLAGTLEHEAAVLQHPGAVGKAADRALAAFQGQAVLQVHGRPRQGGPQGVLEASPVLGMNPGQELVQAGCGVVGEAMEALGLGGKPEGVRRRGQLPAPQSADGLGPFQFRLFLVEITGAFPDPLLQVLLMFLLARRMFGLAPHIQLGKARQHPPPG